MLKIERKWKHFSETLKFLLIFPFFAELMIVKIMKASLF